MIKLYYHEFPPHIFGYAEHDLKTDIYWIFIDSKQCALHQRFTFGHELAHVLLKHHDIADLADRFEDRNSKAYKLYEACESEANRRAWEFYRKYRDVFTELQKVKKATINNA